MLGERRLHLHNFVLFLVLCLGIAAALVAVLVVAARAPRAGDATSDPVS